jgi:hypothetical protein
MTFLALVTTATAAAQAPATNIGIETYNQLRKFALKSAGTVNGLVLQRDRATITLISGRIYLEAPIEGKVRGAVFIGNGNFRAEVPPSQFEKDHVRRMLNADEVESNFETAVLRFSDDTGDILQKGLAIADAAAEPEAARLAAEFDLRMLKETGANVAARVALSMVNKETPGFFLGQFDKGKRGRFSLLLDHQSRLPVSAFGVNGGEKGLIFTYRRETSGNDVWLAFYSAADYQRGRVEYSDTFDLVDIEHYRMNIDVREAQQALKLEARMEMKSFGHGIRAIPLALNEGLGEFDNMRLKKSLRLKSATTVDGAAIAAAQEDWDMGITLFLDKELKQDEKFTAILTLEGDFMDEEEDGFPGHYLRSTTTWYPRHGYLDRSTFDITFRHKKKEIVAATGIRVREGPAPGNDKESVTQYKMDKSVALVTFAVGPFERHAEVLKRSEGDLPVEFYSLSGAVRAIKEDFIVAELRNSVNFFNVLFGVYPYERFSAVYFPYGFGQGFPSLLLLPQSDRSSKYTFAFVSHETAHQWWGNIVAWRSYRDQWLSEGFAEYSGLLYTARRDKPSASRELLDDMRRSLKDPPATLTGIGKGRLVDIGPIILGHRLNTTQSFGAYQALIYNKGGMVLRMLHFLLSEPNSGNDKMFYDMMGDFVKRYNNASASSDDFRTVASEHFARTPIAQKYQKSDLNWFFRQWVYQSHHPTYRMEYKLASGEGGAVTVEGTVFQENAPDDWFMPLPLVFTFDGDRRARGTVAAIGARTPFSIKLPMAPKKVELDPDLWVLSLETTTKKTN